MLVDSAFDADGGEGGYVIGEEVAKRKMISPSSGGSLGVWWLTAALVDSVVVVVVVVMVSIDIMVFRA